MSNKEIRDMILNNRSIRKQILITPKDNAHLGVVAAHTGLSANVIINKALSAYLSRYKKLFVEKDKELEEIIKEGKNSIIPPVRIEGSNRIDLPEEE